jgi:hypothetical protein
VRLTVEELAESGIDLKGWAGSMQRAGRAPGAPSFAIKGPCLLDVRKRIGSTVGKSGHNFIGGELFKLASLNVTKKDHEGSFLVEMMFIPATMDLVTDLTGMTLTMAEAFELLDDLEEFALEHMGSKAPVKATAVKKAPVSAAAAHESNASWGSW